MTYLSVRHGRKENKDDHSNVMESVKLLNSNVAELGSNVAEVKSTIAAQEVHFQRIDLRFDSIEDKVERHLGWHRGVAAGNLSDALSAEPAESEPQTAND
jgi:hypothetical protein